MVKYDRFIPFGGLETFDASVGTDTYACLFSSVTVWKVTIS